MIVLSVIIVIIVIIVMNVLNVINVLKTILLPPAPCPLPLSPLSHEV